MLIALFNSCETTNLELQNDPFELTEESADPSFILNGIQGNFGIQITTMSNIVQPLVDHSNLFGTFAASAGTGTMVFPWQLTYQITSNLKFLKTLSETANVPQHVGVGQILEAYSYITLVDFIGTAVYSEAVNPEFPNPSLDPGADIYNAMYAQLDEAIVNLGKTNAFGFEDFYYDGDVSKWIKLANTIKLRMYVQSKLVATPAMVTSLNAIVASGNYINDPEDDFLIQFGTQALNPDNRHPFFGEQYAQGQTAGTRFQSNYFMNLLLNTKSEADPRTRYYFYRQDLNDPIAEDIDQCTASYDYCYLGNGYIGRDRGDDDGIPNNGQTRTAFGIYPGGGAYDDAPATQAAGIAIATASYDASSGITLDEHVQRELLNFNPSTVNSTNIGGAGIFPILTTSFVKFLLAEASLQAPVGMGASGNSALLLEEAMQASFDKVADVSGIPMIAADVTDYIDEVMAEYNAASASGKLQIIAREYYIANFGNSIEAYNTYRRTGYPNVESHVLPSGGAFIRSFFLPSSEIETNSNPDFETNKNLTDQVFWDTNPAGFID